MLSNRDFLNSVPVKSPQCLRSHHHRIPESFPMTAHPESPTQGRGERRLPRAARRRQVFPAVMSAPNLHTQLPGREQAAASHTRLAAGGKVACAAAALGSGVGTGGPRTAPRGDPKPMCAAIDRRGPGRPGRSTVPRAVPETKGPRSTLSLRTGRGLPAASNHGTSPPTTPSPQSVPFPAGGPCSRSGRRAGL